jgi:hypothetical protein
MRRALFFVMLSATLFLAARSAHAQTSASRCADCHFANPTAPRRDHLEEWDRSPHGRNNVGCEKCHGGNDRVFDKLPAHMGILASSNRFSPVNRRNLPTTCGRCHVGPFVAFQDSTHYKLLQAGNENGPTCSTCHGDADGRLLSPKALASACNDCHGPKGTAPREGRSAEVMLQYEGLRVVREELKLADSLIKRVSDKTRRAALTESYNQAQVPLKRALDAGHKFVYDDLRDYLATSQERVEALLSRLANR